MPRGIPNKKVSNPAVVPPAPNPPTITLDHRVSPPKFNAPKHNLYTVTIYGPCDTVLATYHDVEGYTKKEAVANLMGNILVEAQKQ